MDYELTWPLSGFTSGHRVPTLLLRPLPVRDVLAGGDDAERATLGVDDHVHSNRLEAGPESRILDPGDLQRYTEPRRGLASEDVHSVLAGDRDHHLSIADPGLFEQARRCAIALDNHHVERVLELLDPRRVGVDDDDVLTFHGEALRQIGTNLTGADDDDSHAMPSVGFSC